MAQPDRHDCELIDQVLPRVRRHCEANAGRLGPHELERLADIVLRIVGDDPEYPSRSELEHSTHSVHSLDDRHDPVARRANRRPAPDDTTCPSLQALIGRLLIAANLVSRRQREVARLYLYGHSTAEIADTLGVARTTVQSRWRRAREHLQEALRELSPAEWIARSTPREGITTEAAGVAFRAEQFRPLYRPPQHCPAGMERCAKTGVCAFRSPVE